MPSYVFIERVLGSMTLLMLFAIRAVHLCEQFCFGVVQMRKQAIARLTTNLQRQCSSRKCRYRLLAVVDTRGTLPVCGLILLSMAMYLLVVV